MNYFLSWFRDKGRWQEAADATGAAQVFNGIWPEAHLEVTPETQHERWQYLYDTFGVNATMCDHTSAERKGGVSY